MTVRYYFCPFWVPTLTPYCDKCEDVCMALKDRVLFKTWFMGVRQIILVCV